MITDHPSTASGNSQNDAILQALDEAAGKWVAMPELSRLSGSYNVHSRISDLRNRGHQIEHRNERRGRMIHSFYRLTQSTAQPSLF